MAEQPEDVQGASESADALRKRQTAAQLLVHSLQGDSWGLQDVLTTDGEQAGFVVGFGPLWTTWWEAGHLLRTYLTDDERERMVGRLRQEIAGLTGVLEDGGAE